LQAPLRAALLNGEGTLHHGAGHGLLRAGDPEYGLPPVVLLNALWQSNPASFAAPLRRMAYVSVRDGRSAEAMRRETGVAPHQSFDLSLIGPAAAPIEVGNGPVG
jgi:hypothetical protein